ncbi:MAG: hypothetical protein HYZ46_09530 [Nitrosomonadales bacterium]|nr:hypothetical protein [Nitrosomonadales bacterium]
MRTNWGGWDFCCAIMVLFTLTACATGGIKDKDIYQTHSFSFDVRQDMPDIEVLDYQYSNSRHNGIRANREVINMGLPFNSQGIYGPLLRGDFLYVKWRVKKPGTLLPEYLGTYEDRVDLKSRLPADITGLEIHFVIRGAQLYVYLIWPYDEKHEYPVGELKNFGKVKQMQIYPDPSK